MENKENNQDKGPGLVFNMAMPYLLRIDKLLSAISSYAIREDYRMMKHTLRALFRELSPYISDDDNKTLERYFNAVKKHEDLRYKYQLRGECNNFSYRIGSSNYLSPSQIQKCFNLHNNRANYLLDKLSMKLMKQTHKLGLLIPKKKDRSFIGGEY